jgi:uncharacterized protein with PQ loop repeat
MVHAHLIDRLALGNSVISGVALFPQAVKVMAAQSSAGVSLLTVVLIWLNSLVWLAYGLHRGLISVTISAVLNALATSLLLIGLLIY